MQESRYKVNESNHMIADAISGRRGRQVGEVFNDGTSERKGGGGERVPKNTHLPFVYEHRYINQVKPHIDHQLKHVLTDPDL